MPPFANSNGVNSRPAPIYRVVSFSLTTLRSANLEPYAPPRTAPRFTLRESPRGINWQGLPLLFVTMWNLIGERLHAFNFDALPSAGGYSGSLAAGAQEQLLRPKYLIGIFWEETNFNNITGPVDHRRAGRDPEELPMWGFGQVRNNQHQGPQHPLR